MNNNELDRLYIGEADAEEVPGQLSYFMRQDTEKPEEEPKEEFTPHRPSPDRRRSARKNSRRMRTLAGILVGVVIGVLICVGIFSVTVVKSNATSAEMDYHAKIDTILAYLDMFYIDQLDEQTIENALAKGLLENIGDPYAKYYDPQEFQTMIEEAAGTYGGIGVQVTLNEEGLVEVYKVFEDTPAREAGIQAKDIIIEAGGVSDFEDLDQLVSIVRGEAGTQVDLVIRRGEEEIPMTVARSNIETESVYSQMISDTVGYIQIAEFNMKTLPQLNHALDSLTEQGMESVIMDLRDDPGGDYDSVVAVCDRILPEGIIVSVEDRQGGIITENSDSQCLDIPIVLLVNENTASAAELFTMALHDYGMAQIVGTRTYGKGIVQSIFALMDGSGLKFTTERYYGPNGDCIQDSGVEPDYYVEIPEEAYEDGIITLEEDLQILKAGELLGLAPEDFTIEEEE